MNDELKLVKFVSYEESARELLAGLSLEKKLLDVNKVIIKPNLIEAVPSPCTTDVECIFAIINFIVGIRPDMEIVVIEGSGGCSTAHSYDVLGYKKLEKIPNLKLVDVDNAELKKLSDSSARVYKELFIPEAALNGFFISVPVLKDHLITTVTLGMKNLIGLLPEKHYGGYWNYKRSDVHRAGINDAIIDLNNLHYLRVVFTTHLIKCSLTNT